MACLDPSSILGDSTNKRNSTAVISLKLTQFVLSEFFFIFNSEFDPMIKGLFETHLFVEDLERSIVFYKDILGLEQCHFEAERRAAFLWIGHLLITSTKQPLSVPFFKTFV